MATPIASTSRTALVAPCRLCRIEARRHAAAQPGAAKSQGARAGGTVGKTAAKGAVSELFDPGKLNPVARAAAPAVTHPSYPFVKNVMTTGSDRSSMNWFESGTPDLGGKTVFHWARDRLRVSPGSHPPNPRLWEDVYFSSSHPDKLHIGSILNVDMYNSSSRTASTRFSGMLIYVRRGKGAKTFTLRNVIHKTGVEMTFPLGGPQIKDISIVLAASPSKYKHDAQGNTIYPRWPKNKAYNLDKKPEAWTERTNVALQVMRAQASTDREMAKQTKQLAIRRAESSF